MALARYSQYGDSFIEILLTLFTNPFLCRKNINLIDSIFYLIILFYQLLFFGKRFLLLH